MKREVEISILKELMRQLEPRLPMVHFRDEFERSDRMFINRVVVVHVELHHGYDWFKLWNKFCQKTQFIHSV